jgi:hypothetical protein
MNRMHLNEHDANQGAQSKGEFLGMTGNSGWYLLGSAGASIIILIPFWGVLGAPLLPCLLPGVVLCALSVVYVFTLKNNKPEHYDTDFFESALIEAGLVELTFGPRSRRAINPFVGEIATAPIAAAKTIRREPAMSRAARGASAAPQTTPAHTVANGEPVETKRKVMRGREEPVVALAAYENLRDELDVATDMLEDALVERGEI